MHQLIYNNNLYGLVLTAARHQTLKETTDIKDVKRYLNNVTIAKDGLRVVKIHEPKKHTQERIVMSRQVLDGVITALHIKLAHPTAHQLKIVAKRYFDALDIDSAIDRITTSCHQCISLKTLPKFTDEQTTSDPPDI